jgi:pilus assembly protein CpaE
MADTHATNRRKLALITDDTALAAMARDAIRAGDSLAFTVLEKNLKAVTGEVRDLASDALIVDIDASSVEDFEQLQKLRRQAGANCAMLVIVSNFTPAAARILIQLKVQDFLIKPLQTSDFVRACNNMLKRPGEETQVEPQFIAFMPASGGVGTTTIALEAAQILNRANARSGRTTCVVDLNFQLGSCAEYLDIEPRFDIREIENAPERLDRQLLDVMLSRHASGVSVIAAPIQPNEMRSFKAALVVRLLDLVSAYFDNVVIDLPRIWFPWTDTVIMGSNRLFIVSDMTVPSIRHAKLLMAAIEPKVGKQVVARVLVNRLERRNNASGLNQADVESALGRHFAGGIPNNYRLVREAVDRGVPLAEIEPNNNVSAALSRIVLAGKTAEAPAPKAPFLSLGALFARKAG